MFALNSLATLSVMHWFTGLLSLLSFAWGLLLLLGLGIRHGVPQLSAGGIRLVRLVSLLIGATVLALTFYERHEVGPAARGDVGFLLALAASGLIGMAPAVFATPSRTAAVVFLVVGLLLCAGLGTWALTGAPQTAEDAARLALSPERQDRVAAFYYFVSNRDLASLHRMLSDREPEMAEAAFAAVWDGSDRRSVPVLVEFLGRSNDDRAARSRCVLYLNSGQPELEAAGRKWAEAHRYRVEHMMRGTPVGRRWGSQ